MTIDLQIAELQPESLARARAVLIAGPTASGKSALALAVAARARAAGRAPTIVNADSMQVYDGLRVVTARPGDVELAAAAHRLYGHVPPSEAYSVGRWLAEVAGELPEPDAGAAELRPLALLVGGTGLYFRALTTGLAAIPAIPKSVVEDCKVRLRTDGAAALHRILAERDPAGAGAIRPADSQRLVRALSVVTATGRTLGEWQAETGRPLLDTTGTIRIALLPDRKALQARIARRAEAMVAEGGPEEVAAFLARRLDPELPAMKAIGVREFGDYLDDQVSLDYAVARIKLRTGQYAKRQQTWIRGQMADWTSLITD